MKWWSAALVVLMGAVILSGLSRTTAAGGPPTKATGPRKIYLRSPNLTDLVCAPTSSGWSCRPTATVAAFLLGNARDDCGP